MFELEHHDNCNYDYLQLVDSLDTNGTLIARLCGKFVPQRIYKSITNAMTLTLVTDSSENGRGFYAIATTTIGTLNFDHIRTVHR